MSFVQVWNRLIWKEVRESWTFVALGFLVPPVFLPAASSIPRREESLSFISYCGVVMVLATAVWAVRRFDSARPIADFSADHLPAPRRAAWSVLVFTRALTAGALGAWFGLWAGPVCAPPSLAGISLAWGVCFAAVYLACWLVGAAWSCWAAIVLGLIWAFSAGLVLVPTADQTWQDALRDIGSVTRVNASLGLGAMLGTLCLMTWPRRGDARRRRLAALGTAVLVAGSLVFAQRSTIFPKSNESVDEETNNGPFDVIYEPGSPLRVEVWRRADRSVNVLLKDCRTEAAPGRVFEPETRALGMVHERYVYLAQQRPSEDRVRLIEWDAERNIVRTAASLGAGRRAFDRCSPAWSPFSTMLSGLTREVGFVDPLGRYALLIFASQAGGGQDLWLADLRAGSARVILANSVFGNMQAVWPDGRAILSGYDEPIEIHLRTGTVRTLDIPGKLGG